MIIIYFKYFTGNTTLNSITKSVKRTGIKLFDKSTHYKLIYSLRKCGVPNMTHLTTGPIMVLFGSLLIFILDPLNIELHVVQYIEQILEIRTNQSVPETDRRNPRNHFIGVFLPIIIDLHSFLILVEHKSRWNHEVILTRASHMLTHTMNSKRVLLLKKNTVVPLCGYQWYYINLTLN